MSGVDVARILVVSLGGLLAGLSIMIGTMNLLDRWDTPGRAMAVHISLLGFSYAILVGAVTFEFSRVLGSPPTWRVFVYPIAYVLGFVGLRYLFKGTLRGRK